MRMTEPMISPMVRAEPHPTLLACVSAKTRSIRLAVTVTAPSESKFRAMPATRLSRTKRGTKSIVRMPIGTLTKKIHSQPAYSVSTPPSSTPMAAPEPAIAPRIPRALFRSEPSCEGHRDDREDRRRQRGAGESLQGARRDEHPRRGGEPAEERDEGEERQSGHEHLAPPEQVAHATTEQQESAERQRVGADDPLEVLRREVEILLDRRERDVHDRHVEDDHQVGDAEDGECLPAARIGCCFCHVCSSGARVLLGGGAGHLEFDNVSAEQTIPQARRQL